MYSHDMIRDPEAYSDLDYLCSEAAQSRCVLAAHYLRECPHVIEIGGFKTPLTLFLSGPHKSVTVVDPLMREYQSDVLNGCACRVRHLPLTFQEVDLQPEGEYGFVMLGASLKYFSTDPSQREREWHKLRALVSGARVAVLEAAIDWPLGREILERLQVDSALKVRTTIDLDLSANPGMDPQHFRRRLLVIEGRTGAHS